MSWCYPKSKENRYPILDLVICHGNFLNARGDYIHENKSFRGFGSFGSFGDILVRDRKVKGAPRTNIQLKEQPALPTEQDADRAEAAAVREAKPSRHRRRQ